jgi:hypothetical protein
MKATDADPVQETTVEGYLKPVAGYVFDEDSHPSYVRDSTVLPEKITLNNGLGQMKKRRPCVPRSHIVSKEEDVERYCMRLLQLYWPWRNEAADLKHEDGSYASKFDEVNLILRVQLNYLNNLIKSHQRT